MATEWYLMKSPYDQLSGYEGEALTDFAQECFAEILDSEMAETVELCNYDLSECVSMKIVVQNNLQATKLQTTSRHFLLPISSCTTGMYIKYKNRYWLIVGLVDDNKMYEKAVGVLCNYQLTWLNDNKQVIQRWAYISSATQYNNGETAERNYILRSDQVLVVTPDDDESLKLNEGSRFIIDRRCRLYEKSFDNEVSVNTSNPVITYRLTRADSVLFDYQDCGHYEFMATQDEQHKDDGYYVIDGKGYWLCDNVETHSASPVSSEIIAESLEIYNSLEPTVFMAKFYDSNGNEVAIQPVWNITSDFTDDLETELSDNAIAISVNNSKVVNKSFVLSLSADGYETISKTITVKAFV